MKLTSRKTVSFIEPTEADRHSTDLVLTPIELRSLWYTTEEYKRMHLDYKMKAEIQILVDTLQSRRSHRLSSILMNAQEKRTLVGTRQKDLLALCRIIEQLSCQRQRIAHLKTVIHSQPIIHPNCRAHEEKQSPDMIRAEQKFNRLMRQLNRVLAA